MQHAEWIGKQAVEQKRPVMPRPYQYCPCCGTAFMRQGLHGRERLVCPACQFIFWHNPVVGVAVIVLQSQSCIAFGWHLVSWDSAQWHPATG